MTFRSTLPLLGAALLGALLSLAATRSAAQDSQEEPTLVLELLKVEVILPEDLSDADRGALESSEDETVLSPFARAKVPGGWLISYRLQGQGGLCFYPDAEHTWDGGSPR